IKVLGSDIHPNYTTTARLKKLDGYQADQPQADDGNLLAHADIGLTHALHSDGGDRGEGSFVETDFIRHLDHQMARNRNDLSMGGVADSTAGDAIADSNVLHSGFDDDARR